MSKNSEIVLTDSAVDFLKEEVGGSGTTVIANPELVGDEDDLTGLQVGDTKYKVPQGGGSDTILLGTTYALWKQLQGKHLNVDALLALINKYAPEDTTHMYIGLFTLEDNGLRALVDITADGSNSYFYIMDETLVSTGTYENNVVEFLTNNKTVIEEATITAPNYPEYYFLGADIYAGDLDHYSTATPEEILSLFVD